MKRHAALLMALLSIGLILISTTFVIQTRPPQTVVFDLKGTLDSYQEKLLEAGLSDSKHKNQLAQFDRRLRRILGEYAHTHHLTIVVPGAVISGAPDMTTMLQRHVIEEMKAHQPKE